MKYKIAYYTVYLSQMTEGKVLVDVIKIVRPH